MMRKHAYFGTSLLLVPSVSETWSSKVWNESTEASVGAQGGRRCGAITDMRASLIRSSSLSKAIS